MNEKLNIQDLANRLAKEHGFEKKNTDTFVREFFLLIEQALGNENYVKIKGLGTFKLIEVGSRESVNVNTGERFKIDGHTKVSFTPDVTLRDLINKPFAHFETVVLNENTVLENTEAGDNDDEVELQENIATTLNESPIVDDDFVESKIVEESVSIQSDALEELPTEIHQEDFESFFVEEQLGNPTVVEEKHLLPEEIIALELKEANKELPPIALINSREVKATCKKEDKTSVSYLITIIVVVLLLCGGVLAYIYYPEMFSSGKESNSENVVQATVSAIPVDTMKTDAKPDTVAGLASLNKKEVAAANKGNVDTDSDVANKTSVSNVAGSVKPDSVNYIIAGTKSIYTVKEGETLTRVSLRFYGTKDLWPYIVKHNRDVIKNPDNVPYGTILKIPELTKNKL